MVEGRAVLVGGEKVAGPKTLGQPRERVGFKFQSTATERRAGRSGSREKV